MKKIFFIIPSFRRGGVERVTLNILNSLDTTQFEAYLLICVDMNNEYISFLNKNIKVIELKKKNVRGALFDIFKMINAQVPDLIFTSFNHVSLPILAYKKLFRKKYHTVVRLNTLPSNKLRNRKRGEIYGKFFKYFLKTSDEIISQSNEMSVDISNHYKIPQGKITTIQNPVNVEEVKSLAEIKPEIQFDKNYFNLIAVGSLSEVKGFDLLIEAMNNLFNDRGVTKFRLYVIGDNRDKLVDYKSILQDKIEEYNLLDSVFLLGFKKNPFPFLNQADAFVLSSRKEGFPNVVLEALVLGKPCLVTNCVDLSGIINSENGVIVEKDSANALEEGLLKIVNVKGNKVNFVNFDFTTWFLKVIST